MIVWLNGTHGAGKTTTSALVQELVPGSRVFDAEKVGETLMDVRPGLPETDDFQHWREISAGLAEHGIPVRHFVLHADQEALRERIQRDPDLGPSWFRLNHLEPYAEAARTWLHGEAEVIDTTYLTPAQAARQIADALRTWDHQAR